MINYRKGAGGTRLAAYSGGLQGVRIGYVDKIIEGRWRWHLSLLLRPHDPDLKLQHGVAEDEDGAKHGLEFAFALWREKAGLFNHGEAMAEAVREGLHAET